MQELLDELPFINHLVYRPPFLHTSAPQTSKTIKFSSGQNIKTITLMKYQYFKLIYSVLVMIHSKTINISAREVNECLMNTSLEMKNLEAEEGEEILD